MPKTKSAAKRVEITKKKTLRNSRLKSALRTAIKKFEESRLNAKTEDAKERLQKALISLDKAVSKGILHKNTAARKKSQLAKRFNAIKQAKEATGD